MTTENTSLTDESQQVQVRMRGAQVEGLTVGNNWRRYHQDAKGLSLAITELIKQGLRSSDQAAVASPDNGLAWPRIQPSLNWSEFLLYRRQFRKTMAAIASGELTAPEPPENVADERHRVAIDFDGWAFADIAINPEWLEKTNVQELNDVLNDFLVGRALVPTQTELPEITALRERAMRLSPLPHTQSRTETLS